MGAQENRVEKYLCKAVAKIGGEAYKWKSPQRRFVLDRILNMPEGLTVYCEVKSKDGDLSSGQKREIARLQKRGHLVSVVSTFIEVDALVYQMGEIIMESYKRRMIYEGEVKGTKQSKRTH